MADDPKSEGFFSKGQWSNLAVVLGVIVSLFTGVQYAVTKVNEHDSLMQRVAQLEAQKVEIQAVQSQIQVNSIRSTQTEQNLTQTVAKVDALAQQMIELRIRVEQMVARLERK